MSARLLRVSVGLGATILLAALAGATLLLVWRLQSNAAATATDTVERAARAVEATVNRQFLAVDGMLAGLPPLLGPLTGAAPTDPAAVSRVLRDLTFQNFNFRNLLLVRPDGSVWASGLPDSRRRSLPVPPDLLAGAARAGAVAIIGPMPSPTTGEWNLFFARDVHLPGIGRLLAVAEVPVPQISAMLAPISDAPGLRLTVERRDGTLLTSVPHDEGAIGRTLARPLSDTDADGVARTGASRIMDLDAMVAARSTLYRNILVTVGWERRVFEAGAAADRRRLLLGAAAAGLLLLALACALNLALRQRERGEAERAAARATLESAIEALPDGFVMFDQADRVVIFNTRFRDLYQRSGNLIQIGATFESIVRGGAENGQYPHAGPDLDGFVAGVLEWHHGNHPPREWQLPDGRWLRATERRTTDGGTVGVRTDITLLKQANAESVAAHHAAAAATRAKSLFLARMSHELRTPLNGVLGLAQALAGDPGLPAEARQRAATLEAAGRHLVALSNDLLDLARIEEGRLELHPTDFELRPVLSEAITLVRSAANERDIQLDVVLADDLPSAVVADATRLRQLLLNLLSNAVKFTPQAGQVTLCASRLEATARSARVRIEVRDTGPGVAPESRQAIFGDFVQVAGGHARGGAGLGLAIAAQIVQRMGGQIGCDTAGPRGGALFWAELPLTIGQSTPPRERVSTPEDAPHALRILVVDDVASNLAVARALLGSVGHAVVCAESGPEALRHLAEPGGGGRFDIILMDLMMPGMDGLETTRRIRALAGPASRVPILAVTASAFPEDIAACLAAGMDDHLAKPIERAALLRVLTKLLEQDGPATPPLLEPTALRTPALAGLEPAAADRLRAAFVDEITQAREALRVASPTDTAAIAAAAHRLAGAAATLGAARLEAQSRQLETAMRRPLDCDRCVTREQAVETATLTLAELRSLTDAAA